MCPLLARRAVVGGRPHQHPRLRLRPRLRPHPRLRPRPHSHSHSHSQQQQQQQQPLLPLCCSFAQLSAEAPQPDHAYPFFRARDVVVVCAFRVGLAALSRAFQKNDFERHEKKEGKCDDDDDDDDCQMWT